MSPKPNWIFLSKQGQDPYINRFASGSGFAPTNSDYFDVKRDMEPEGTVLVLRGILKKKIMDRCRKLRRLYYYMDTGYFGNQPSKINPHGFKLWHRVVPNDLQHSVIIPRPADRFLSLGITMTPRRWGSRIIIAAPDDKPCQYYGIDREQWITQTLETLESLTDRPILVRQRSPSRRDRTVSNPLSQLLEQDTHALVTFNSVAATEAIMQGVPAFVLAPTNAAAPVANHDLTQINEPFWPDNDLRDAWAHHLAYGQFHVRELDNGTAFRMLQENQ